MEQVYKSFDGVVFRDEETCNRYETVLKEAERKSLIVSAYVDEIKELLQVSNGIKRKSGVCEKSFTDELKERLIENIGEAAAHFRRALNYEKEV